MHFAATSYGGYVGGGRRGENSTQLNSEGMIDRCSVEVEGWLH